MSLAKALQSRSITRVAAGQVFPAEDNVAVEEPLEVRVSGRSVAVVMRTPGHDRELAAGFLVTEGVLRRRDDLLDIVRCTATDGAAGESPENILDVLLAPSAAVDLSRLTRHIFTSSSCGICSRASIDAVRTGFPPLVHRFAPRSEVLFALPRRLADAQKAFARTGGLHASALFDPDGVLQMIREDVGRHNALDKVIGAGFLADTLPLEGRILMVSGRVSFELMQKALAAGISCVAAISAPTSAAIEFAEASGQTLIGFIRGERLNVYAGTLDG